MMKKRKSTFIAFFCALVLSINTAISTGAVSNLNYEKLKSENVVFLTEGQGDTNVGDGTIKNPYRNIKTALSNVEDGGTIKIVGTFNYWRYEEHHTKLPRPLIINKEVTFEGVNENSVFLTRAPIQLASDVTFRNIKMEFWASNELMPGVPDSGLPGEPVDEGVNFRSGRSIYLAGNTLTMDNVDTRIPTVSFQQRYRPYINGGTFLDEGATGPKSVLNVINPNSGTEFAGIYAGDYWKERNYPVELNIMGKVLDKTIHTGGIIEPFRGDVEVNIYKGANSSIIDMNKHNGNVDVNIKENAFLVDADFTGIRNLTIESKAKVSLGNSKEFNIDNITLKRDGLLDLRKVTGNAIVKDDFIGDTTSNPNEDILGGAIFLHDNQILDVMGDVIGITRLNSYSNYEFDKVPLKDNHIYVKAKENTKGDFKIYPGYIQSDYRLEKSINDSRTIWTAIRDKSIFKEFRWNGSENDNIIKPEEDKDYIYPIDFIDENDKIYKPVGEDWNQFTFTLTKPDGTILDDNNYWDFDLGVYLDEVGVVINIYNTSFSGELNLTVSHESGQSITKKVQIGETTKPPVTMVDLAKVAERYNLKKGQPKFDDKYDLNKDDIIDIYDIVIVAKDIEVN